MVKYCQKCNGVNEDFAVVCINCGERIEEKKFDNNTSDIPSDTSNSEEYIPPEVLFSKNTFEFDKKNLVVIIPWVVILLLIVSTFFLPWYSMNVKISGNIESIGSEIGFPSDYIEISYRKDLLLSEVQTTAGGKTRATMITGTNQWLTGSSDYNENDEIKEPIDNTSNLAIISAALVLILIIGIFILMLKKIGKIIIILLIFTIIISLMATMLYFTVYIPKGISKNIETEQGYSGSILKIFNDDYDGSFSGSEEESILWSILSPGSPEGVASVESTWSPSYGWYMILITFILSIISLFVTIPRIDIKKEEELN